MNNHGAPTFRTRRLTLAVIAPHPDDDILGCGILIRNAQRARWRVVVIALTDGQASHPNSARWPAQALGRLRRAEMRRALARLAAGTVPMRFMGWRDGSLEVDGSALLLRRILQSAGATDVAVASAQDHHPDHRAAWLLARAATAHSQSRLHAYEVWARCEGATRPFFSPGKSCKHWAMQAHRSQVTEYITDDPEGFVFSKSVVRRLLTVAETLTLRQSKIVSTKRPVRHFAKLLRDKSFIELT